MKKRAYIEMQGDVDGVGFRFLVKQKAQSLGLKGFCKQNEDKEIIIDIEGDSSSLEEFLTYIQKGVSPMTHENSFAIELIDELAGYTTMETDII